MALMNLSKSPLCNRLRVDTKPMAHSLRDKALTKKVGPSRVPQKEMSR